MCVSFLLKLVNISCIFLVYTKYRVLLEWLNPNATLTGKRHWPRTSTWPCSLIVSVNVKSPCSCPSVSLIRDERPLAEKHSTILGDMPGAKNGRNESERTAVRLVAWVAGNFNFYIFWRQFNVLADFIKKMFFFGTVFSEKSQ